MAKQKGRGAGSNPPVRFRKTQSEIVDDGWWQEEIQPTPATSYLPIKSRTIISTNRSPDIPFDYSINPYMGCEHGCIYCYARPSHAYWDLSPGLDFETRILTKPDGPALLREAFNRKHYVCKTIHIGANTDPYQPAEISLKLTSQLLEVFKSFQHPFTLITKSALVLRDLDLLQEMAEKNLCTLSVSVTTLNGELKRTLEPRAASPAARLRVIESLAARGIPVSVFFAPVIPWINDHEMEAVLAAAASAGARQARYVFLRLPLEIADLMEEWLEAHYPLKARHVMNLVCQARKGKSYDSGFGSRMTGEGAYADLLGQRFRVACKKLGLLTASEYKLDTTLFTRPGNQMSLF